MAEYSGSDLLHKIIDTLAAEVSALQQKVLGARLQQMLDAGISSNLQIAAVLGANQQILASVPEGEASISYLAKVTGAAIKECESPQNKAPWSLLMPAYRDVLYVSDGTADGSGVVENISESTTRRIIVSPEENEAVIQFGNSVYSIHDVTQVPQLIADDITTNAPITLGSTTLISDKNNDVYSALITDGSHAGTTIVLDMEDYSSDSFNVFDPASGVIWSATSTVPYGRELFFTQVSTSGIDSVGLVQDINPGASSSLSSLSDSSRACVMNNGLLLFRADDGTHGNEPWISDGTAAGTFMLDDLRVGSLRSEPISFTPFGELAAFRANTSDYGVEIVVTDGTKAGTKIIDINENGSSIPTILGHVGDKLYVEARVDSQRSVYSIDSDLSLSLTNMDTRAKILAWGDNIAYFTHSDPDHGTELWALDAADDSFHMVKDVLTGTGSSLPENAVTIGDHLLFSAYSSATTKSWFISDGTEAGTVQIAESPGRQYEVLNGTLVYADDEKIYRLKLSDSLPKGEVITSDYKYDKGNLQFDSDQIFFSNADGTLHVSTATAAESSLLLEDVAKFKVVAEDALYIIQTKDTQTSLWFSDGTMDGTYQVSILDNAASRYELENAFAIKTDVFLDVGA